MFGSAVALWALGLAIDHVGAEPSLRYSWRWLRRRLSRRALRRRPGSGPRVGDRLATTAGRTLVVAGAAVAGLLAATALVAEPQAATGQLARNVAGLTGLVALGAVFLGAARAPLLPVLWTVLVLWWAPPMGEPPTRPAYKVMLTWMAQPTEARPATVAAIALAAAGTLAYAVLGSRR